VLTRRLQLLWTLEAAEGLIGATKTLILKGCSGSAQVAQTAQVIWLSRECAESD
jgi:hypothetical protein